MSSLLLVHSDPMVLLMKCSCGQHVAVTEDGDEGICVCGTLFRWDQQQRIIVVSTPPNWSNLKITVTPAVSASP